MSRERTLGHIGTWRLELGARATALVLVFMVSALTGGLAGGLWPLMLLVALAAACSVPVPDARVRRWRPLAEAVVAGLLVATSDPYDPSLLPYLVIPSLSAGLIGGWTLATITSGGTALSLMSRGLLVPDGLAGTEYLADVTQWVLLAAAVGLLAAWLRRLQDQPPGDYASYLEATRLLTQLRDVSRELSGGLDVVAIASDLLEGCQSKLGADRGWVFGYRPGGQPVLLASVPLGQTTIAADLGPDTIWSQTVSSMKAEASSHGLTEDHTQFAAVAPVAVDSLVALVAVERRGRAWTPSDLESLQDLVDMDAIRLDAAMLFDEVRSLAASEERQRLAREIHDGVAQEVASLGYVVDDLAAKVNEATRPEVLRLRAEISRVVTELRFSIFDLRREIGPGGSLTSALAEHAQHVGESAGLTVHLELSETPQRLRTRVEAELLRIAQEAIANARRHSKARNLWLTCLVAAPDALLRIEDDGHGLGGGRDDSFGLAIMRERAHRADCTIEISSRDGSGTRVEVRTRPQSVGHDGRRAREGATDRGDSSTDS